jgi:molybdopterin-containing oxidoreductase family membrane subunit
MVMGKRYVMGVFPGEAAAAAAANAVSETAWTVEKACSPIPSVALSGALKVKKSRVGYFTLAGGIFGFFAGFALAVFTATRWDLIVSGKPVVALVPFFIVGFEFTILFAVFGNIVGMLTQARIPDWKPDRYYDGRCSGEHFGVLASCPGGEEEKLAGLFRAHGGEVKVHDA